jgi:mediator of RNA polymerase II transcription subunit 5
MFNIIFSLILEQCHSFRSPIHYHVLNTLLLAESTPITVLRLCAPSILRIISESAVKKVMPHSSINLVPLRKRALHILGLSDIVAPDGPPPPAPSDSASGPQSRPVPVTTIPLEAPLPWDEQPAHAIHTALADAHAARAPMLDLARCLRIAPPTRVIHTLWTECLVTASVGGLPIARQLATFVLCTPGTGPPLLPLFLFLVLPQLLISIEQQPPHEQAVSIELLVAILSSSLTAALHLEMISGSEGENHMAGADITISFSAKLARDLRGKEKKSSVIRMILQRLASMHAFSSHFPMFLKST